MAVIENEGVWSAVDSEGNVIRLYPDVKVIKEVTGSTMALTDSHAGGLKINSVYGKSTQVTTTGAQLFDASMLETKTEGGTTVTNNGDGSFTISGRGTLTEDFDMFYVYSHEETLEILKAGSLFMKCDKVTYPYCFASILDSAGNNLLEVCNKETTSMYIDITGDLLLTDGIQLRIGFWGASGSTISAGIIKPMMYFDGDSDGAWEQYTGRVASPSPSYPQEIVSVGDDGSIDVGVYGKNLLENTAVTQTVNGVTFTVNEDGSVTVSGTATDIAYIDIYNNSSELPSGVVTGKEYWFSLFESASVTGVSLHVYERISDKWSLTANVSTGVNQHTLSDDCTGLLFRIVVPNGTTVSNLVFYPMIRLASIEDDTYEPYTKQSIPISRALPGIPVTDASLATYTDTDGQMWCADEVDFERGVYVQRVRKKAVENISENSIKTLSNGLKWEFGTSVLDSALQNTREKSYQNTMVDKFTLVSQAVENDEETGTCISVYGHAGGLEFRFRLLTSKYTTAAEAASAIEGTILYYPLATPIETPLTDEELAAWRALRANEPVTTIISDATVEVEYGANRVGALALENYLRGLENESDIEYKDMLYTKDGDHRIGFTWTYDDKGGHITPIIDKTEQPELAFRSDVSTVSNDYVEIGVDDYTEVSASVCMTRLSKNIANIVINYKITSNTLATDVYRFIDMDKLKTVLGLTYLGFPIGASTVILHPAISYSDGTLTEETAYANAEQRGLTGLMMGEGGGLCRIYEVGSTAGAWPLNCAMYKPGTYGTIIINGATIA